jgi:7-cyano-7-deazaguanine synthase
MTRTIVVVSGGIDSTTALALYATYGHDLTAISVDYGQRHLRELDAAEAVAGHYGVPWRLIRLPELSAALGGSALTDPGVAVPLGHYADVSMAATVVPNRNAILANIAGGVAVAMKADAIVLGVHAGDHPIYPDCRPEFVTALNACLAVANDGYHVPRVEAPFVHQSKTAVVALGARLGAPLHLTWSCYQGSAIHCGRCGTCVERIEAFTDAGVDDPTEYGQ